MKGNIMAQKQIYISDYDYDRLDAMVQAFKNVWTRDMESVTMLQDEINRAKVIPQKSIGVDVVTMNSKIRLKDLDTGTSIVYELVFPEEADLEHNKISILAPVGVALLGYRVGDRIQWPVPAGVRTLEITEILYQPEAAGNFDS